MNLCVSLPLSEQGNEAVPRRSVPYDNARFFYHSQLLVGAFSLPGLHVTVGLRSMDRCSRKRDAIVQVWHIRGQRSASPVRTVVRRMWRPYAGHSHQEALDRRRLDREQGMEDAIRIENRSDFGQWAIDVAKQIVSEHGFELARSARAGTEEDVRAAGNALGQAITNALFEVYDGLLGDTPEE